MAVGEEEVSPCDAAVIRVLAEDHELVRILLHCTVIHHGIMANLALLPAARTYEGTSQLFPTHLLAATEEGYGALCVVATEQLEPPPTPHVRARVRDDLDDLEDVHLADMS